MAEAYEVVERFSQQSQDDSSSAGRNGRSREAGTTAAAAAAAAAATSPGGRSEAATARSAASPRPGSRGRERAVSPAPSQRQRLIASWLPPKPQSEQQESTQAAADEDEDFRGDSEIGGIGSLAQKDDSGLPEGAFKRRNPGANDKLLDSLLGKKAANAHRKAQALAKSATAQSQEAPKPVVKEKPKRPAEDSDSEEEGGRAAAFKSKRAKPSKPQSKRQEDDAEDGAHVDTETPEATVEVKTAELTIQSPEDTSTATKSNGRKRPASYLDELLGQKANKKNKKKNKSAATNAG